MSYFNKKNFNPNQQGYTFPCVNNYRGRQYSQNSSQQIKDYGPYPFAVNIEEVTKSNNAFRTVLWTGEFMQLTLMNLLPGEDIGLELHSDVDQFVRIEQGKGILMMGDSKDTPNFQQTVFDNYAFIIPAGKWHNLINIGSTPLKLYSIYAPPQHPFGTVHETKAIAEKAEEQ
ncbi:MAG: cupin domain-containing protein [Cellulosilyticaceae bacterium]